LVVDIRVAFVFFLVTTSAMPECPLAMLNGTLIDAPLSENVPVPLRWRAPPLLQLPVFACPPPPPDVPPMGLANGIRVHTSSPYS